MMGELNVDPDLLESEHRRTAHVTGCIERRQIEIATLVKWFGPLGIAEVEELQLGGELKTVEAHVLGTVHRTTQDKARIPLVGCATERVHVANQAGYGLLLRAVRQDRKGARVRHREHVGLLNRVKA